MTDLATALCRGSDLGPAGQAPDLVHLLPLGEIKGRDGRRFVLDNPGGVISASLSQGLDLVIDYEHQGDDPARRGSGPVPAAGWIRDLVLKADGIWGRVVWTERARNMIAGREYRYLSPVLTHRPGGEVVRLKGASLVHRPNLELTALSSQETTMTEALARVTEALGLAPDAGIDAILAGIEALGGDPDPSKYVPIKAVNDLLAERNTRTATMSQREAEAKVTAAMDAGYLTPAMRDWAVALCHQDPDSFDAFMSSATPAYAHLFTETSLNAAAPRSPSRGPLALAIATQLGIAPEALDG